MVENNMLSKKNNSYKENLINFTILKLRTLGTY